MPCEGRRTPSTERAVGWKTMVEDGHLSNAYQYGGAPTYYLNDVTVGKHEPKNNNDSDCVVVLNGGGRQDTDEESDIAANGPLNSLTSLNSVTTGNCVGNIGSGAAVGASGGGVGSSSSADGEDGGGDVSGTDTKNKSSFAKKCYDIVNNGSSHIERSPSQNYFDVAKEPPGASINERNYPQERHKTAIALLVLIFNFFLTTTSLAIIHDHVPKYGPLPDMVLNLIEARSWALVVSEVLIMITTTIMLFIILAHKYRFIIFRRLFLMLSLLYLMRSITMFVTVLPVSSPGYFCSPQKNSTGPAVILERSLSLFFGMGLTINGKHTYCGDYIYSGHTTILVMSYLMISEYSTRRMVWLHRATWLASLIGVLMVLISHSHYTVDVIIGYYVTTRLFWLYHTLANNQFLKKQHNDNYLAREWWFPFFKYFEGNVKGPLPPLEYR